MVQKKYKDSKVEWDTSNNRGNFLITSKKGKKATGVIKKNSRGVFIALIQKTDYAPSYVNRKVKHTLNKIFNNEEEGFTIQSDTIDCLSGYLYTDTYYSDGLEIDEETTLNDEFVDYCPNGAHHCGGQTYTGPVDVIFKGTVIGVCANAAVEYAKFKIN